MWFSCMKLSAVSEPSATYEQSEISGATEIFTKQQSAAGYWCASNNPERHRSLRSDSNGDDGVMQKPAFVRDSAGRLSFGNLEIRKTLGVGAQAKVVLAKNIETNEYFALKVIDKSNLSRNNRKQINNEIIAMRTIKHPNVLTLRDVHAEVIVPSSRSPELKTAIVLVLDLCTGGELFDLMLCTGGFPEIIARTYFTQILDAISTCHAAGIYHRDIKPQNILIDSDYQVKIADFGLSALHTAEYDICNTYCGTMSYMAPEIIAEESYSGAKADCWSLGVLLFFMLAGNPPLNSATSDDWWYKAILTRRMDKFWRAHERLASSFSTSAQALLNRMLVANPVNRCTVEDVLEDVWLDGHILSPKNLKDVMIQRKNAGMASETVKNLKKIRDQHVDTVPNGAGEMFDTFRTEIKCSTYSQSTPHPPHLSTWKNLEEVTCAYENVFHDNPDGFFVKSKSAHSVLESIRHTCTETGANKVQEYDPWTLRVTFDGKEGVKMGKTKVRNLCNQVEVEIILYRAKKRDREVIFVRLNQTNGDSLVGKLLMKLICRGAMRHFKMS